MPLSAPQFRPPPLPEPAPVVRVAAREDFQWNRPLFKAPSLEVLPNIFLPAALTEFFQEMKPARQQ